MKQLILLPVMLVLAACDPAAPVDVAADAPDTCGKAAVADLIGQPESVLAAMTFPEATRILHPNSVVTMDYRPDRLNIHIGADGLIERLDCV